MVDAEGSLTGKSLSKKTLCCAVLLLLFRRMLWLCRNKNKTNVLQSELSEEIKILKNRLKTFKSDLVIHLVNSCHAEPVDPDQLASEETN